MVDEKELKSFFKVCDKYGIPYRKTPRTKEEIENLVIVKNTLTKEYDLKDKDVKLGLFEKVVTPSEIFESISETKKPVKQTDDNENTLC